MGLRTNLAVSLTAIYLFGFFFVLVVRWQELLALSLNELGDFLAGSFGPLALAWLVFGYFQQGDELRQGTEALRLQATELNNSVLQQAELAKAANLSLAQSEVLLDPLLQIEYLGGHSSLLHGVELQKDIFLVRNSGAYCEELVFRFRLGGDERGIDSLSVLSSGQAKEFSVTNALLENIYYDLCVDYIKSNRVAGRQDFEVQKVMNENVGWQARIVKKFS